MDDLDSGEEGKCYEESLSNSFVRECGLVWSGVGLETCGVGGMWVGILVGLLDRFSLQ